MFGHLYLLTLTFVTLTFCLNFTEYKAFVNPDNNYTKAVFSPDYIFAIFYGPSTKSVAAYSPSNWTAYESSTYQSFDYPCTDISSYIEISSGFPVFLYGSQEGDIRKRTYQQTGYIDGFMWTLNDTANVDIVRIIASPLNDLYATFCRNNSNVYTSSLFIYSQPPTIFDFSTKGNILSIAWKGQTTQLAISGGNTTNSRFFLIYDVSSNSTTQDLTSITSNLVLDVVFNSDGSLLYFIQQTAGQQNVQIYELSTGKLSQLAVTGADQLTGIGLTGNFLTVYDATNVYVWDLVGNILLGSYPSTLKSSCLAPDGSQLIILATTSNSDQNAGTALTVYKLCSSNQFFNETTNTCDKCQSPCVECFFSASRCGSCPNQTFLSPPSFTCAACISNCLNCYDNSSCQNCLDTYFYDYDSKKCLLCSGTILACIDCYNKNQCKTCNTSGHWEQTPNLQCACMQRYVQFQSECLNCPNNCLNCSNTSFCLVCDYLNYWTNTTQGTCVCKRGYYISNDECSYCWKVIEGCLECPNQHVCNSCEEGYTLNTQTKQCDLNSSSHTLAIVLGTVGGAIGLALIGIICWKCLKKKDNQIKPEYTMATEPLHQ